MVSLQRGVDVHCGRYLGAAVVDPELASVAVPLEREGAELAPRRGVGSVCFVLAVADLVVGADEAVACAAVRRLDDTVSDAVLHHRHLVLAAAGADAHVYFFGKRGVLIGFAGGLEGSCLIGSFVIGCGLFLAMVTALERVGRSGLRGPFSRGLLRPPACCVGGLRFGAGKPEVGEPG
jgi:hypothetical protein